MRSPYAFRLPAAIRRAATNGAAALAVFVPTVGGYVVGSDYLLQHRALPDSGGAEGQCAVWLIGSSSIHRWRSAAADMPQWTVHNRGIEGASLDQIRTRLASTPAGSRPSAVVLYAGENDIARGATAEEAVRAMVALVDEVEARAPGIPAFVVSMKPSPTRWGNRPAQLAYDTAMRRLAAKNRYLTFLDTSRVLLADGRPGDYYNEDGVHLDADGYRRWGGAIGDAVARAMPLPLVNQCKALKGKGGARPTA